MFNGAPRVVDASVTLAGLGMHAELNLVDAVAEAEDGHVCTLDRGDYFVHLALVLSALIVGGDRHEVSELLGGFKVGEPDALVHLVEKADFVEGLLEVPPVHLVVHEALLGQEMQVLLERLADQVALQTAEDGPLGSLALQKCQHAPGDAHHGEVLLRVEVLLRGELQDVLNCRQVLVILVALLGVARDVDAVQTRQLSQQVLARLGEVHGHYAGAASLEEVGMGRLEEALEGQLDVRVPLVWQRLREDSKNGLVGLGAQVVPSVLEHRRALVAAQMERSFAN